MTDLLAHSDPEYRPLMLAVRAADEEFEKTGDAGTKTWLDDYFLPALAEHGLTVASVARIQHVCDADCNGPDPEQERLAAIGAAVERLPHRDHGWLISRAPDESLDAEEGRVFEVRLYDQPKSHYRRTLTAAILAAIGAKP